MTLSVKKLINAFQDEFQTKNLVTDLFSNNILNRAYNKTLKVCLIMQIYLKFILNDYNYEANLKSHIKKTVGGLTESLINIVDNFLIKKINLENFEKKNVSKEFLEKYYKLLKTHKINFKNNKTDLIINQFCKNIESVIIVIKQFSK